MTQNDLSRIETALKITLPALYRKFALQLEGDDIGEYSPFNHVDEIISRNQEFRRGELVDGWKPELFCIGTFEGGDFFVDLTDLDKGVFLDNSNSGSDNLGGQYDPEDYSDCWFQSFNELANG